MLLRIVALFDLQLLFADLCLIVWAIVKLIRKLVRKFKQRRYWCDADGKTIKLTESEKNHDAVRPYL